MRLFHICTIANDACQYAQMRASFEEAGFTVERCRYTLLDNTAGNVYDPYQTLSRICRDTPEPYIIFCHQDIRMDRDERYGCLVKRLEQLNDQDSRWAVAGNAGSDGTEGHAAHVTDPRSGTVCEGPFPRSVTSLDENFLVIRSCSRIGCSDDLSGFHLYASDLCMNALQAGYSCYVIDFHLTHLSGGNPDSQSFRDTAEAMARKWDRCFRFCFYNTPCTCLFFSRYALLRLVFRRPWFTRFVRVHYRRAGLLIALSDSPRRISGARANGRVI